MIPRCGRRPWFVALCTLATLVWLSGPTFSDVWMDPRYNRKKPKINWRNDDGTPKRTLRVYVSPRASDEFKKDVEMALKNWNDANVGWTFTSKGAKPKTAEIVVRTGNVGDALGRAKPYNKNRTTRRVWVDIDKGGGSRGWETPDGEDDDEKWNRERIIKHELGHAIGIEHTHDLATHPGDVLADGTTQDPANDDPVLTDHDKQEARAAAAVSAYASVNVVPAYRQNGILGTVAITAGPGADLLLDQALAVTLSPVFPDEMTLTVLAVTPSAIEAQVSVASDACSDQGFTVKIQYPSGSLQFAGVLTTGPDPDPGLVPHAVFDGAAVEQFGYHEPVVLDPSPSYHDDPAEYVSTAWSIDGIYGDMEGYWMDRALIGPGIHLAKLIAEDRWGHVSVAEKTVVVGTPTLHTDSVVGGGTSCELLIDPLLAEAGVAYAVSHSDVVSGQILYSESDGSTMSTELIAQALPGAKGTSLALDPISGARHVAFYDPATAALYHAQRHGPGNWTNEEVPDPSGGDDGAFCEIAVDPGSNPRIAYANRSTQEVMLASWNEGLWVVEPISPYAGLAPWVRLVVDAAGQSHVAWRSEGTVLHAKHVGAPVPESWRISTVATDASPFAESALDLALNGDDDPVITYVNDRNQPTIAHHDGVEWQLEPTVILTTEPLMLATRVDADNTAHLVYQAGGPTGSSIVYLSRIGGEWAEIVLDPDIGPAEIAVPAIALTPEHTPCAAYGALGPAGDPELRVTCIEMTGEGPFGE